MKKLNKIWIIISLVFHIIYSQGNDQWITLVDELNPTNGYENWKKEGDGDWKPSAKCKDSYGDNLSKASLTRQSIILLNCEKLKISLNFCLNNEQNLNQTIISYLNKKILGGKIMINVQSHMAVLNFNLMERRHLDNPIVIVILLNVVLLQIVGYLYNFLRKDLYLNGR